MAASRLPTHDAGMLHRGLHVRLMHLEDVPAILDLERICFPGVPEDHMWKPGQVEGHVERFPDGQFVIEREGRIIGSCTNALVPYRQAIAPHTWHGITGGGYLRNHDPHGDALYGTEIMVHPEARRMGVGRTLFETRFAYVVEHGLRAFVTGGRIPGYHRHARDMLPQEYIARVERDELTDPVLTPDLRWGMHVEGVLPGYLMDPDSLHYATLLVWENPHSIA